MVLFHALLTCMISIKMQVSVSNIREKTVKCGCLFILPKKGEYPYV